MKRRDGDRNTSKYYPKKTLSYTLFVSKPFKILHEALPYFFNMLKSLKYRVENLKVAHAYRVSNCNTSRKIQSFIVFISGIYGQQFYAK